MIAVVTSAFAVQPMEARSSGSYSTVQPSRTCNRRSAFGNEYVVTIHVARGSAGIDDLADEWRRLCAEGPCDEPFLRLEWMAAVLRHFEPDTQVMWVPARRDGLLRGVLPLIEERIGGALLGIRRLRTPVNAHSNRFDLIHGAGDRDAVVEAIWNHLAARRGWDMLQLDDLPAGGPMHHLVGLARRDRFPTAVRQTMHSPYVPLPIPAGTVDDILARTNGKHRNRMRRRMRRLKAQGPVRLMRMDVADPAALERFYALESSGWKGCENSAIVSNPNVRAFYDEVAEAAARHGYLALYELRCGDRPIAAHFGFTLRDRYFMPKVAYDETYGSFSPGHLIVQEIMRDCLQQGIAEFDMLGNMARWKADWASDARQHYQAMVFSRRLKGRGLHAGFVGLWPFGKRLKKALRRRRGKP